MAIAASLATIELLARELIDNAAEVCGFMMDRLRTWPARYANVGDVRGMGLMIGIEFVKDRQTRERHPARIVRMEQMMFERGVLVLGAGQNSIRLCPPLVITRDQAAFAMDTLEQCLREATA